MAVRNPRTTRTALASVLASGVIAGPVLAQDTNLTVWSDTPRLEVYERYDELDNGVSLNVVTVAPNELVAKLQLALRADGEVPDVVWLSSTDYAAQLSTRRTNFLADLGEHVSEDILAEFSEGANTPCTVNGKLLCLRNDIAQMVTWYDAPLMEELGLEVPETWSDFEAIGETLAGLEEDYYIGSAVEPYPILITLASSDCEIGFPVEGAEDTIRVDLGSDECLRAARMMDRMRESGVLADVGPFDPAFAEVAKDRRVPLMVSATWFGEYVMRPTYEMPEGTLTAALPPRWEDQDQPRVWSWGGGAHGVNKDSGNLDAAVDLVVWATTDIENQKQAVTLPAHEPSAAEWVQSINEDGYYHGDRLGEVLLASAEFSHPSLTSLRLRAVDAIGKVVVPGLGSGQSLEELLPTLEAELRNNARLNGYTVE